MGIFKREYRCYGGAAELFHLLNPERIQAAGGLEVDEILLDGPAGTGKTRAYLELINALATTVPGLRVGIVRKTRVSANESWIPIFETHVLGPHHPAFGRRKAASSRDAYFYPNDARVVPLGMDTPTRLFSSEWHILYAVEWIELREEDSEELHRGIRAPTPAPFRCLMGDTNPGPKTHWLNGRFPKTAPRTPGCGHLVSPIVDRRIRIATAHSDNPVADAEYLRRLGQMSGNRYKRLGLGEWISAEGLVWEGYDPDDHLLSGTLRRPQGPGTRWHLDVFESDQEVARRGFRRFPKPVELVWFYGTLDFGFMPHPGTFQVWGVDENRTAYLVAEVYRAGEQLDWWGAAIAELHGTFDIHAIVADHEPRSIAFLNHFVGKFGGDGAPLIRKANKGNKQELVNLGDYAWSTDPATGRAHAYLLRDSLWYGRCPHQALAKLPLCFAEEILDYTLQVNIDGIALPMPDKSCPDHGCDAAMYGWEYAFGRRPLEVPGPATLGPGVGRLGVRPLGGIQARMLCQTCGKAMTGGFCTRCAV